MRFIIQFLLLVLIVNFSHITEANNEEFSEEFLFTYNELFSNKEFSSVLKFLRDLKNKYPKNPTVQYWVDYKIAQLHEPRNRSKSCQQYKKLRKKKFPVPDLLDFKIASFCKPNNIRKLKELSKEDSWIQEIASLAYYKSAVADQSSEDIIESAILISKQLHIQSEKLKYSQIALAEAQKIGNQKTILKIQKRIGKIAPRLIQKLKPNQYFKVAYDYRRNRDFPNAIKYYKKILDQKQFTVFDRLKAWRGIRISYKLSRDKKKFIQATFSLASLADQYYRKNPKNHLYLKEHYKAQIILARSLWTEGQVSKTIRILKKLKKWVKGKKSSEEIYWLLARIREEKGQFKEAIRYAQKGINEAKKASDNYQKLLWVLAWNYRKTKNLDLAESYFKQLVDLNKDSSLYKFWFAKTLKENNKTIEANILLSEVTADHPFSFYSLLAYREMEKEIPSLYSVGEKEITSYSHHKLDKSLWSKVEWLILFGEKQLAQEYIHSVSKDIEQERGLLDLLNLYAQTESFQSLFIKLARIKDSAKNKIVFSNPEFLFPRPWEPIVKSAAKKFGVKSELIYSVIRQESSFNPFARSPADAFGLMQILPKQARKIASENEIPAKIEKAQDLYQPKVNIPIGAAYLRELWDRYNGQFILTVASYNAAESAVKGWIKTRFRGDPLEFIEDIPYSETKGYIKLVMRNMIYYIRMNHPDKPTAFPEWCLENLEDFT